MLIHQYEASSGQYISSRMADADPRNPGRWLVPAFTTDTPLPVRQRNEWPFLIDGRWVMRPDFRGQMLYRTDTGEAAEILVAGVGVEEAGLTTQRRPSGEHVWIDGAWRLDPARVAQRSRETAMNEFEGRLRAARTANAGKADAYAAGLLSPGEQAVFKAWAAYQMELVRQVEAQDFPASLVWPPLPDVPAILAQAEAAAGQAHVEAAQQDHDIPGR